MAQKTFDELLQSYESALTLKGIGYASRYQGVVHANQIFKLHENKGITQLDEEIIAEYIRGIEQRLFNGEMSKRRYQFRIRHINRFLRFCETGEIDRAYTHKGSRYALTPKFEKVATAFLSSENFHPNTRNDMRWVTHKYFTWLTDKGHEDMSAVDVVLLQKFLLDCANTHPPNTMHNIRLYLKKLYVYLYSEGMSLATHNELLSFRTNRETKIFPTMPMSDVTKLLESIDRRTKVGKRSYAIMVLGAELGLRACDVASLKLGDIDWVNGEIKVIQSKTNKAVVLPLTQKVGEALHDYILNARPATKEVHMFLRLRKPHTPLKAAVTIGEVYRDCCKVAGLPVNKRFHSLRRSLATSMVTNGVAVTTVAQVLGDNKINSTKNYISLDTVHLKRCALSFEGIAPLAVGIGGDVQ